MKLLIAEDDPSIRSLIELTVPDDWTVLLARDGVEAVSLARQHRPDAVIVDHTMPVLTGVEVCEVLAREDWRADCTIIALTASRDQDVRRKMTTAGADAFLSKPFSPVELLDLLGAQQGHRG